MQSSGLTQLAAIAARPLSCRKNAKATFSEHVHREQPPRPTNPGVTFYRFIPSSPRTSEPDDLTHTKQDDAIMLCAHLWPDALHTGIMAIDHGVCHHALRHDARVAALEG